MWIVFFIYVVVAIISTFVVNILSDNIIPFSGKKNSETPPFISEAERNWREKKTIINLGVHLTSATFAFVGNISSEYFANETKVEDMWPFFKTNWQLVASFSAMIFVSAPLLVFFIANMYRKKKLFTFAVTIFALIIFFVNYRVFSRAFSATETTIDGKIALRGFDWREDVDSSQFICTEIPLESNTAKIDRGTTFDILDQISNWREQVVTAIAQSSNGKWLFIRADDILGLFSPQPSESTITAADDCYFWVHSQTFVPIDDSDKVNNLVERDCDQCK